MKAHISVGRWFVIGVLVLLCIISFVSGAGLIFASSGAASSHDVEAQGTRRDCVTTLQTARRSVFDNVDIYKAIQIEQLSTALLNSQAGTKATPEQVEAFRANDLKLRGALTEARRLQPSQTLDDLIAHGGIIAGKHYDACPS